MNSTILSHENQHNTQAFPKLLKRCCQECRAWSYRQTPLTQREQDTRLLLQALDLVEEARPLNPNEATLHRLAAQGIQAINSEWLTF
jgi:hypothetical protein